MHSRQGINLVEGKGLEVVSRGARAGIFQRPPPARVRALLAECGLPDADLLDVDFEHFLGCGPAARPRAVIGLELLNDVALLRSLAVTAKARSHGLGRALVVAAERYARQHGVASVYLLTTNAEGFFQRLGYTRADRGTAPDAVQRTREFSHLCPDSAVLMHKHFDSMVEDSYK